MKTIFIIVSGIADIPDLELEGRTPLMLAATPSLDALAKCGCCGSIMTLADDVPLTKTNAILSLWVLISARPHRVEKSWIISVVQNRSVRQIRG